MRGDEMNLHNCTLKVSSNVRSVKTVKHHMYSTNVKVTIKYSIVHQEAQLIITDIYVDLVM